MEDNLPYISVSKLNGAYHINKHVWVESQDCYQIVVSRKETSKGKARVLAHEWAKREGIEVR